MDILVSPQIERLIRDALDEDIGAGDLATMATISAGPRSSNPRGSRGSISLDLSIILAFRTLARS